MSSSVVSDDPSQYIAQRLYNQKSKLARQTAKVTQAKQAVAGGDLNPIVASFRERQAAANSLDKLA
ncbi:MAG: hypothetical protein LIQ30_04355 [Planctomycetes bacterium]|nr:hypothetical protein [Planctomycetota bacterium]MCD7897197.1 hypothetical protein [Planctomycetaceae bacterium]